MSGGVAVVTRFAALAGIALGVVQAPEAGACLGVTRAGVVRVDVVVALTGHAAPTGHHGVPEVARSALLAPGTWRRQLAVWRLVRSHTQKKAECGHERAFVPL